MKRLTAIFLFLGAVFIATEARAQHTLGVTGGYGFSTGRFYPEEETRMIWGNYTAGLSWRFYGPQRVVGGFGIDLEFLQRGFSFAPNASDREDYLWYTRRVNSLVMPIIWQPHFYIRQRVRVFVDLAAFFSYNISSTYVNGYARITEPGKPWQGDYNFKPSRDNRWGYGLAGGGGVAVLVGQLEFSARVRYYFGYSDLLRNYNKYPDNLIDGPENPFDTTPIRSPIDNLTITVGVAFRFNKGGFTEWENRPRKRERRKEQFDYK